jgi:nicotinamidase/pyrazinamidase
LVVATQDWHPPNHVSFVSQNPGLKFGDMILDVDGLPQEIWPDHCVQNTPGADFVSGLNVEGIQAVVQKGTDPQIDSYSGFFDNNHKKATELASVLRRHGVDSVYVLGLATDYCVKFTALDARSLGFQTYFVRDASRAIGDEDSAVAAMVDAGVRVLTSAQLL